MTTRGSCNPNNSNGVRIANLNVLRNDFGKSTANEPPCIFFLAPMKSSDISHCRAQLAPEATGNRRRASLYVSSVLCPGRRPWLRPSLQRQQNKNPTQEDVRACAIGTASATLSVSLRQSFQALGWPHSTSPSLSERWLCQVYMPVR